MSPFLENDFQNFEKAVQSDWWSYAQRTFDYQSEQNMTYRSWLSHARLPYLDGEVYPFGFMPISFFKRHQISSVPEQTPVQVFTSSGTSGVEPSRNPLYRPDFYRQNTLDIFENYFDRPVRDYRILALLPSYLERDSSSLVHMVHDWMSESPVEGHSFYLHDKDALQTDLRQEVPTILIGVTYALIDLVESIDFDIPHCLVIETGGMKGRADERTKSELHSYLHEGLGAEIYSEYGMTELMSQAYMSRGDRFRPPAQMRVLVRDEDDPLSLHSSGRGALNIIDLANMDTASFIATDDLGVVYDDGSFEVLGRIDAAEVRGCSQMYFL